MSMKRLSEKYSALHHATLGSVLDNFGLREEPEAMALRALEEDRLQAREDVKRLAAELRNMAPFRWRGSGAYCWCPEARGAACFDKRGEPTGRGCITKNDLLREVGAVRQ